MVYKKVIFLKNSAFNTATLPEKHKKWKTNEVVSVVETLSSKNKDFLQYLLRDHVGIPLSIFRSVLSPLESIVKYLVEHKELTIHQVASILNRSKSSLYTTYTTAKKKHPRPLMVSYDDIVLPYSFFSDRKYSILETLVHHLHVDRKLSLKYISELLDKDYSTIKTVYWRYNKKIKMEIKNYG